MLHLDPEDAARPDDRPELLALRTLKLGDLLVAVPAIHGLRRAFPEHRLVLAVPGWLEPVVELVDGVDALLPTPGLDHLLPLAPGRVDVAVNLHGSGPESRRLIDALEARISMVHHVPEIDGPEADSPATHGPVPPTWSPHLGERARWVRLLDAYGVAADPDDVGLRSSTERVDVVGAAVVHVGAFYESRRWPVERFAAVARSLADEGRRVVFTGSAGERDRALRAAELAHLDESSVLAGRIGLAEFAGVVEDASVVVSADTGAAHLASAYRRPSVVLFGPAAPEHWGPPPGPHIVLTDASVRRGDAFADTPDPAILAVGVDDVLDAVVRAERAAARRATT
ncbi:glycosyltransferase family 9 protein [Plantibacter cousiniae (nom. nud.)]|uniref:ADP-heptose:LPS heptosyltransferase n=1 Tax=Plantibacter cousiniae (nom. nud.) TaxID=199709 RepID=A0ABY1LKJ3_9MICO|nr:glycosyltransferase family 9 protein [Plantibacter cousiniae]SKC42357.1 ADP-heptose:LPS heptosyltransferase [Plantibacter cousiniae]